MVLKSAKCLISLPKSFELHFWSWSRLNIVCSLKGQPNGSGLSGRLISTLGHFDYKVFNQYGLHYDHNQRLSSQYFVPQENKKFSAEHI